MNLILTKQLIFRCWFRENFWNTSGIEDDLRENILKGYLQKGTEELDELNTGWCWILSQNFHQSKRGVISGMIRARKDIIDLLRYDEDSAGGLMGKG
jgi:magnesium transporter